MSKSLLECYHYHLGVFNGYSAKCAYHKLHTTKLLTNNNDRKTVCVYQSAIKCGKQLILPFDQCKQNGLITTDKIHCWGSGANLSP